MFAVRNSNRCTKDCLCLFICPTGATDTENGQIDRERCIDGCRLCVDACPSHAIYLMNERYPERRLPSEALTAVLSELLRSKSILSTGSMALSQNNGKAEAALLRALGYSARILAEDCVRESGYMVPEKEHIEALMESGVLQRLFSTRFEGKGAEVVVHILGVVVDALGAGRDAEDVEGAVCEKCGFISLGGQDAACAHCGHDLTKVTA
jgi:Fe-S-cluster-containing hydrogenase component 2